MSTTITQYSARFGSPSQSGWRLFSPTAFSAEFSMPDVGLKANWNSRATITIDRTCGKK